MRKKYIISALLLVSLSIGGCAFADTYSNSSYNGSVVQTSQNLQPVYMNWYDIDRDNFKVTFRPLSSVQIKSLSDTDKAQYKQTEKIEKLLAKGTTSDLQKAKSLDGSYIPTILKYYNNSRTTNDKITYLNQLARIDTQGVFPKTSINNKLADEYFNSEQYEKAVECLEPVVNNIIQQNQYNSENYKSIARLAYAYTSLGNYNNALKYAKMVPVSSMNESGDMALKVLWYANEQLGNKSEAYKYAKKRYEMKPDTGKALVLANLSTNETEKLTLLQKAKSQSRYSRDISEINAQLAEIYQKRFNNAVKSISGYYTKPDIQTVVGLGLENDLMECLNYKGNDLKAALSDLNNKVTRQLDKMDANKRAAKLQLIEEQRVYAIQQQNQLQAQQNQLIKEQNWQISRPRFSNTYYYDKHYNYSGTSSTVSY